MVTPEAFTQKKNRFFSRNLVENFESITPLAYLELDTSLSGLEVNPISNVINSHIRIAHNISSIIHVSAVENTSMSALDRFEGISPYFIKQNNLTHIEPEDFERDILRPLGKSFRDFPTSASFNSYLEQELIPSIRLNAPTAQFTAGQSDTNAHMHLVSSLNWVYFLNTPGDGGLDYSPSSWVKDTLVHTLYAGQTIQLVDAIKGVEEFIAKNYETCSTWNGLGIIPTNFLSGTNTWTSGTQQLEKLKTLTDVIYSPLYINEQDYAVYDAFQTFQDTELVLNDLVSNGPFRRLLEAFSYSVADTKNDINRIETLADIEKCPEEYLPLLAELIGWDLFGPDPDKWRIQLRNAVDIYKRTGTKQSIQIAMNSLFPRDLFDVSSSIQELWESYIPHLMYYSLATESYLFYGFDTWTFETAKKMKVDSYSTSSMDDNLRLVVDNIILSLAKKFPNQFILAGKPFPIGSESFQFRYRGRVFPIPPWEEIPYYTQVDINEAMIVEIVDTLVCFGVRESFAFEVGDYIRQHTLHSLDDIAIDNAWLMFTVSSQTPPNWYSLISDVTSKRDEFLSLWNGKSSHYRLDFESQDFDFAKNTLEVDSRLAIVEAARIADSFAPATAIRQTRLFLSATDNYPMLDDLAPIVLFDARGLATNFNSEKGKSLPRYGVSAHEMNAWKRNTQTGQPYSRDDLRQDGMLNLVGTEGDDDLILKPRNAFRRRNYKHSLQDGGLYTRTGFNMPMKWDSGIFKHPDLNTGGNEPAPLPGQYIPFNPSGFYPLGFIPSACKYADISSLVYHECETLSSMNIFFGVPTSSTWPCRGLVDLTNRSNYVDRGQLDPFIATIANIDIAKELQVSSSDLSSQGYYSYALGKGLHRLYTDYRTFLEYHTIPKQLLLQDGKNIFAHAYGSILENSREQTHGRLYEVSASVIASSVDGGEQAKFYYAPSSISFITPSEPPAPLPIAVDNGLVYPVYPFNSDAPNYELRTPHIVSGCEYIIQSGTVASETDYITTYNLQKPKGSFATNNVLIKVKNVNTFNRIAYDTNTYFDNLLIPEHDFEFKVKCLIGNESVDKIGGAQIGVWIHTLPENGKIWSYTKNHRWEMEDIASVTEAKIIQDLAHITKTQLREREDPTPSGTSFRCVSSVKPQDPFVNHEVVPTYEEREFLTPIIKFNTKNKPIKVPEVYYKSFQQLHRASQVYKLEVFIIPNTSNKDKFLLLDEVDLIDKTQNDRTKIELSAITLSDRPFSPPCSSLTYDLSNDQLWSVVRQFRLMSGGMSRSGINSRNAITTSSIMEVSGGSRIDYRVNPDWPAIATSDPTNDLDSVDRFTDVEVQN